MHDALRARCREALEAGLRRLPDKPEESVDATLAALWHAAAGVPTSSRLAQGLALEPLDAAAAARLEALLERRLRGEPLAHLTGRQHFMGLEMLAAPAALIPRVETELLARGAIDHLEGEAATGSADGPRVVDVCTGCGNLALAIAHHVRSARVFASDLSEEAVALARKNARHLALEGRVDFRVGDLLAPFEADDAIRGAVDLVVCNPPYISSAKVDALPEETAAHEPRLAFDGGPLGIRILNRLIVEAPRVMRPGGLLLFEVGLGQARGVRRRLEQHGYRDAFEVADAEGQARAVGATWIP